jgi:hypothetical protein
MARVVWSGAFLLLSGLVLLVSGVVRRRMARRAGDRLGERTRLREELARAAEAGGGLHIALGTGSISGDRAMSSTAALRLASTACDLAVSYGLSPTVYVGDPTLLTVAQDGLRRTYEQHGIPFQYDPAQVRFVAPGLLPYAVGAGDALASASASPIVIAGAHGSEISLIADHGVQQRLAQHVAVDSPPGSAAGFAITDWHAPAEALFAAGAQDARDAAWLASLTAQDVLRWVVVGAILLAGLGALLGG